MSSTESCGTRKNQCATQWETNLINVLLAGAEHEPSERTRDKHYRRGFRHARCVDVQRHYG